VANIAQRSFAGGELAPALFARTDLAKYLTGLRKCRNMTVQRHGGVTNDAGTELIVEVKDSTKKARLIEFIFNSSQTYILEFGDLYMRVIKNGAQVLSAPLVPFELVTPYTEADLPDLQWTQSADVVTLVHPNYAPRELKRTGDAAWTLTVIVFTPAIAAPATVTMPAATAGPHNVGYAITAVADITYEESLPVISGVISSNVNDTDPVNLTWDAVAGAQAYNIYRAYYPRFPYPPGYQPNFELVGTSVGTAYRDTGVLADSLTTPPKNQAVFDAAGKYPAVVGFTQQRRTFAQSNNEPEKIWCSRTGHYNNFSISFPIQDDDAVSFNLSGRQVNTVRHLLDIGALIFFTEDGGWLVQGGADGILRPGEINPLQKTYYGANKVPPVIIGNVPIYVESRGSMVLDFRDDPINGYAGNDLTVFAAHLFEGLTLVDMAYQRNPNSIVWVVRSDGCLLGLTYLPEQAVWGWHRHDTDGLYEDIAIVPEGKEDKLYLIVKRTINGVTKRYIERMANRFWTDIRDAIFTHSTLSYDGRNTTATTMSLSGGVAWLYSEDLTLASSVAFFAGGDVGSVIVLQEVSSTGKVLNEIRLTITAFTDNQHVTVNSSKTVPVNLRNSARTTWSKAVSGFGGLSHLEGKNVSILADGFVKASPNNAAQPVATVIGGVVTIDKPASVVHIGLPFLSDVETLDLDSPSGQSRKSEKVNVNRVLYSVEKTRGVWVGMDPPTDDSVDPLEGLDESRPSSTEDADVPPPLITDTVEVGIDSNYNNNGRIFLRQVDPLPFTLLAAIPGGYL
jgi:hypothetical protein